MKLKALIVDDEPLARESLKLLLSRHGDVESVREAAHGREALAMMRRERPDVLFLDVQMPGMTGLDVLRKLGTIESMAVVFVTAYDRYAIQAFENRALDYLLKPFTDERFEQVLARTRQHIKDRTLSQLGAKVVEMLADTETAGQSGAAEQPSTAARSLRAGEARDTIIIKDGKRTILIPAGDIDWIEATDYYARVHTGGRSHLIRESLKSLADTLDPSVFVRVHRSALVNVSRIRELEQHASGDAVAVLHSGHRIRVSRTFRSSLLSRASLHDSSTR